MRIAIALALLVLVPLALGATPFVVGDASHDQSMVLATGDIPLLWPACDDPRSDILSVRGAPAGDNARFYDLWLQVRDVDTGFSCAIVPGATVTTIFRLMLTPLNETPSAAWAMAYYVIGQSYQMICVNYGVPGHLGAPACSFTTPEAHWNGSEWHARIDLNVWWTDFGTRVPFIFNVQGVPSQVAATVESRYSYPSLGVGLPGLRVDVTDASPISPTFAP